MWAGVAFVLALAVVFGLSKNLKSNASGKVVGQVWVTTNAGASFDQREVTVTLMPDSVDAKDVSRAAGKVMKEIRRRADSASELSGIMDDAKSLDSRIAGIKGRVTIAQAMELVNVPPYDRYGKIEVSDFFSAATRSTLTDIKGQYAFDDVPPGSYYVESCGYVSSCYVQRGKTTEVNLHP
jgi:hypothetical protein